MRRRTSIFFKIYSFLVALTLTAGIALGEQRVDLYVSMFILWYFVLAAVLDVQSKEWLSALLFVLFTVIVAYRVIMILGGMP